MEFKSERCSGRRGHLTACAWFASYLVLYNARHSPSGLQIHVKHHYRFQQRLLHNIIDALKCVCMWSGHHLWLSSFPQNPPYSTYRCEMYLGAAELSVATMQGLSSSVRNLLFGLFTSVVTKNTSSLAWEKQSTSVNLHLAAQIPQLRKFHLNHGIYIHRGDHHIRTTRPKFLFRLLVAYHTV
jgi:hypothetical protein